MTRWNRRGVWLAGAVATLLTLLFSLDFILTRTTVLAPLKEAVLASLCEAGACHVDFEDLEVHLFPEPHVVVSKAWVSFPGRLSGTLESLSVFPKTGPLFTGRFELGKLRLISPKVEITVPGDSTIGPSTEALPAGPLEEAPGADASAQISAPGAKDSFPNGGRQGPPALLSGLNAAAFSLWGALSDKAPGLHLDIEHGEANIIRGTSRLILLKEFSAAVSIPPGSLRLKIDCRSDYWEKLAVDGWLDPGEATGKGRVVLRHFQAQQLAAYLPPTVPRPVDESPVDLDLILSSDGPGILISNFKVSGKSVTLQTGQEKSLIRDLYLDGELHASAGKIEVEVTRFAAKDPDLSLTGAFLIDSGIPQCGYRIECRDMNAAAVRQAALALIGQSPVVQDIFEIIRGGTVPLAIFEARGASLEDLQKSESLVVRGSIQNGEVFIPKVDLRVDEVYGDVLISQDLLEGKNLHGRIESSTGCNGSLTVALTKGDGPFHLDIEIDADLAQLPPILRRVVDSKAFRKELGKVQEVSGRANGRLILGETLEKVSARVEVGQWNLKGFYERFPFPLELEADSFFYEGPTIAVGALRGSAGNSQLFDGSGSLDWSGGPFLQLAPSTRARISLDELYPWIMTLPGASSNRWSIRSLAGTLWIDSLEFRGFLSRPDDWHFLANCRIEGLESRTDLLPDTLRVKTGAIVATPKDLKAENCSTTFLDASLTASGKFTGYSTDLKSADLSFRGEMGPQFSGWASELFHLPRDLHLRTPLSTTQTRLNWAKKASTSLSSVFTPNGGPEVAMDLDFGAQELSLKQLSIRDQESNAALNITIREGEFALGFRGDLTAGTMDRLFLGNRLFGGSLSGDFSTRVIFTQPGNSSADGKLKVEGLWYALKQGAVLALQDASLEAKGSSLQVKTASFRLMETPMEVAGSVAVADNRVQLDLDLHADGIDWNKLREVYPLERWNNNKPADSSRRAESFEDMPIRGNLKIKAGSFTYDRYRWKPLRANLQFAQDGINIEVTEARLCSIPASATIIPSTQGGLLVIKLDARDLDLDPTLSCLWDRQGVITGSFNLEGEMTAKIQQQNMNESVQGNLNLVAWNGRVYRSTVLAKIFDLLNFTEIYRGRLPDLANDGCAYDSFVVRATLKDGKVLVQDAVFDGRCAKMVATGEIDPEGQKVDFTVLVSPLKTVDTVIRHVPLIGNILGGSLVSIPVRVSGDLSDPSIVPLSPSAVGSGLLGTMKRVFQHPLQLIQPLK